MVLDVRNTGLRDGKQVVQVYLARPFSGVDRPARWLVGSAIVRCLAGQTCRVEVPLPWRALAHWVGADACWQVETGRYEVHVGTSSADLPLTSALTIG